LIDETRDNGSLDEAEEVNRRGGGLIEEVVGMRGRERDVREKATGRLVPQE